MLPAERCTAYDYSRLGRVLLFFINRIIKYFLQIHYNDQINYLFYLK